MHVRLTIRLLDPDVRLLGWTDILARMPGDGTLRAREAVVGIEQAGVLAFISVHWPDAHVEVRSPAPGRPRVEVGQMVPLAWTEPIMRLGTPPTDLPCVTVRQAVRLEPPPAQFGMG